MYESSAGLKGLVGGALWSEPSDIPGDYEGVGFAGSAGGFAWGVAAYYEGRIAQYFGFELDVGYDSMTLARTVTFNEVVDVEEEVGLSGLRAGLLLKGIVPTPFGRAWLGVGGEHLSGSSTSANLEITDGEELVAGQNLENAISAKSKASTLLTFGIGLVFHAGDLIEIPVDLRASRNMSQDEAWDDRVTFTSTNPARYEVVAQPSWDFRLGLGVGARF